MAVVAVVGGGRARCGGRGLGNARLPRYCMGAEATTP